MYLNLRRNARPAGLNQCTGGKNCVVPEMTVVQINSGKSTVGAADVLPVRNRRHKFAADLAGAVICQLEYECLRPDMKFRSTRTSSAGVVYLPV